MAAVATLALTPIPASASQGGVSELTYHGTVTAAGGAGTYLVTHGLPYKPTFVSVIAILADGVAPTAVNAGVARCSADDTATAFGINVAGNGTYDVVFG